MTPVLNTVKVAAISYEDKDEDEDEDEEEEEEEGDEEYEAYKVEMLIKPSRRKRTMTWRC